MKTILTATIAAAISFAISASTGFASHSHSNRHIYRLIPGDHAVVESLDIDCLYEKAIPSVGLKANLSCDRLSTAGERSASAAIGAFRIDIATSNNARQYYVLRAP